MSAPPTLAETIELHLDALYECDAAGLLLRPRGSPVPPPRVHLVRSIEGNRWLLSTLLPANVRRVAQTLLASEPVVDTIEAIERRPPACRDALLALLGRVQPPIREYRGPAFTFPGTLPEPSSAIELLGSAEEARPHPDLAWLATFDEVDRPIVVARNDRGEAVAQCHAARPGQASAEAGLEVAAAYRRHGLARAVTLGWARAVRAGGRVPLYSTSWENEASRGTARSLGLVAYAEDWHID